MPSLQNRLDRLESLTKPVEPLRIIRMVVDFISAEDGRALPWDPQWASVAHTREPEVLWRAPGEDVETFEERAKNHFPAIKTLMLGCNPAGPWSRV